MHHANIHPNVDDVLILDNLHLLLVLNIYFYISNILIYNQLNQSLYNIIYI